MRQKLQLIIAALLTANGNKEWMLSEPIMVRINNFIPPTEIHGLQVSTKRELAIAVEEDNGHWTSSLRWYPVEEKDSDGKIIDAIHDRIVKVFKTGEVAA